MNLNKLILTKNACYISGKTITPKGIMVHSTGANNPNLKRYVGPDDGKLGKNANGNHWNTYHPDGREICCHAFIGKLKDGTVATYQTLPWNYKGWHCGGSGNNSLIGFEICEDGLNDKSYFTKVYNEAVELCVYLCKQYELTEKDIICHCEGYKKGIATNHGDVMHWFPKFGKSMDSFRADVKAKLNAKSETKPETKTAAKVTYKVRKTWADSKSQKGAYTVLKNAKECADKNPGYKVFNDKGNVVYEPVSYTTYTVAKGDSLWLIAKKLLDNGDRYTEIIKLNGLKSSVISVGQKLKVPKK